MELKNFKHTLVLNDNEYLFYGYSVMALRVNGDIVYSLLGYSRELRLRGEVLKTFRTAEEAFAYADALPELEVAE